MCQKREKYRFSCGCEWDVIRENGKIVSIDYDPLKAPLNCPKTWEMLCAGKTLGTFQLETRLGQIFAKRLKPISIEELADLISVIRPGVLDGLLEGKSLTAHFIDRKHGKEKVEPPHPLLEEVTKDSYGIMISQEQSMLAVQILAKFTGPESYRLIKAIGKKKPEIMAELKEEFINGAINNGVIKEDAEQIFAIIEASQRYSFVRAHGVAYALDNYIYSAYPKAHFPKAFFTAQLDAAKNFTDINDFINDAMENDVCVVGPDIRSKNAHFLIENNCIRYGLGKIKHVSSAAIETLRTAKEFSWTYLLYQIFPKLNSQAVEALIKSGAIDLAHMSRKRMLHEYKIFKRISVAQKRLLNPSIGLRDNLLKMQEKIRLTKSKEILGKRLGELDNPPFSLEDSVAQICRWEQELLGYSFTYTELDDRNLSISNCTCGEFLEGKYNKSNVIRIGVVLDTVREHKVKRGSMKGEPMAFASGSDQSGKLSSIVFFPSTYYDYSNLVFPGNRVIIQGKPGQKDSSFIVERVFQL